MTLCLGHIFELRFTSRTGGSATWEKDIANPVVSGLRQLEPKFLRGPDQEVVRHLNEDPGTVPNCRVGPHRATVVQVEQDLQALLDDLVTPEAVHVRDETDATSIVLVTRVIETLTHRESVSVGLADHHRVGGVGEDQPISTGDPLGGIPVPRFDSSVMHLPTLGSNPTFQQKITMM